MSGRKRKNTPYAAWRRALDRNLRDAENRCLMHRARSLDDGRDRPSNPAHKLRISRRWQSVQRTDDRHTQYVKLWLSDGSAFRCVYQCSVFADGSLDGNWHGRRWDDRRSPLPTARGTREQPALEEAL